MQLIKMKIFVTYGTSQLPFISKTMQQVIFLDYLQVFRALIFTAFYTSRLGPHIRLRFNFLIHRVCIWATVCFLERGPSRTLVNVHDSILIIGCLVSDIGPANNFIIGVFPSLIRLVSWSDLAALLRGFARINLLSQRSLFLRVQDGRGVVIIVG